MIKITNKDSNYLAKVMLIDNLVEIEGANTLQKTIVDFQEVAISKDMGIGDVVVFFVAGSTLDKDYLHEKNLYASSALNSDTTRKGYFNKQGLVKATKFMKGAIKSTGFIIPAAEFFRFYDIKSDYNSFVGSEFDTVGNKVVTTKYVVPNKSGQLSNSKGKQPKKLSRLVDGQVHLHDNTTNFRKIADTYPHNALTSISYKLHGTSGWASKVLVKSKLTLLDRILKFVGINIVDTEYDLVYGSRRVVKNKNFDVKGNDHYYNYDLWGDIVNYYDLKSKLPEGYSIYYEIVGFTKEGGYIQEPFDYGIKKGKAELYVYRVTYTNTKGLVFNLNTADMVKFCESIGLTTVPIKEIVTNFDLKGAELVEYLESKYTEKDCYICSNSVPEEGVVIRDESDPFTWSAYKLKSFRFLEKENKNLEKGIIDIEEQ